ncbi:unnamed protein product [Victoria cruziana]
MVHTAYDSFQILRGVPSRIESVAAWNSKLLFACADGSLRVYSLPSDRLTVGGPTPSRDEPPSYVLERTVPSFSRKGISVSILSLGSRNLLLSLTDAIAFHRLPSLEAAASLSKTKGANSYDWDDRRGFLCVGRQRKVIIYRHEGGKDFTEVKEFNVPDVIKSMIWCGENICLSIKKEYMIMNSTTGTLSEVFPCGRIAAPLVTPLPSEQLLLGKDNIGVFVDQNGKLLQEGRICWSEPPGSVTIQVPYAIGRLPRHIEVRSLRVPYQLVQTIAVREIRQLLSADGYVVAALDTSVYGLLPVPLGAQIVQLAASGNFEEALALCKQLPPEDSTMIASKEKSIHLRYGHHLFDGGSYEEAMDQFAASKVDINYVLSLYPFIQLPKAPDLPESGGLESHSDASLLSRIPSDVSDDMEGTSPSKILEMPVESTDIPALEHKKMSHNALIALIKFLQKKRNTIIEKATSEGTEEAVADAVQGSIASSDYYQPTRLRKPLCGSDPILVLDFSMKVLERHPSETIELFLSGGVPPDLVNSYLKQHSPQMQATYLEHMLSMNEHGITANLQNELVQFYLSQVLDCYATLSAQKKWDEEAYSPTRRKLISALENTSGYNPENLLKRLPLDALYEERALLLGRMQQHHLALSLYVHKLHRPELALAYCDRVYENALCQTGSAVFSNIYLILLQIYLNPEKSTKESEQRMLSLSSSQVSGNQKGNAVIRGKGARGMKKIAEIEGADDLRWNASGTDSGKSDVDGDEINKEVGFIMTDEAIDLLSRKWNRINGAQALRLLPKYTKLQNLLPFLEPLLRKSSEGRRNYSVVSSLRQSENLQVKEELYTNRKRMVAITSESMCSLCNKRIGTSVFAVYPNATTLVHFVCFRDSQNMKALRGSPAVRGA